MDDTFDRIEALHGSIEQRIQRCLDMIRRHNEREAARNEYLDTLVIVTSEEAEAQ